MKKRLGLDIDGTITCPTTFIPYLNEAFNQTFTLNDITLYDVAPLYGVSEEDMGKWFAENEGTIYKEAPLAEYALEILSEWKETFDMFYISARNKHAREITEQWFITNTVPYNEIELLGSHDKLEAIRRSNIDLFLEDRYENAYTICEQCNIPVVLFDTPYNQGELPKQAIRVYNWLEAKDAVLSLLKS